jgi:hypothetical protein
MKQEDLESVTQRIFQEGFHYCFVHYSNFEEIDDEKFHELRKNYLKATSDLEKYLQDLEFQDL